MRFALKLILTILFIPLFLILLIGVTVRFQFLSPSFWENTFTSGNTYSQLSISLKNDLELRTVQAGGKRSDIKALTDLVSPEILKDLINGNIRNILLYANGKSKEIIVYLPLNKLPTGIVPVSFRKFTENMRLADFMEEFNISGISDAQIRIIGRTGAYSWVVLATSIFLAALIFYLLWLCTEVGKRLIAHGVALIISGTLTWILSGAGNVVGRNLTTNSSIIKIIVPTIIGGVIKVWMIIGVGTVILGIILFFVKKGYYNKTE